MQRDFKDSTEVDTSWLEAWGQVGEDEKNLSPEFKKAVKQMKKPSSFLLQNFRAKNIEELGDDAFLNLEQVIAMKQAFERGDKTYPINLKEYYSNSEALYNEHKFLCDELDKALHTLELVKVAIEDGTIIGTHPNTMIMRNLKSILS